MRRSKELIVLVVLLLGTVAFVLWYVIDRRAEQRERGIVERPTVGPLPDSETADAAPSAVSLQPPAGGSIDLDKVDGKTLDLSRGKPVVKDSAEDRAAMDAALREMEEAAKDVTFDAPRNAPPRKD